MRNNYQKTPKTRAWIVGACVMPFISFTLFFLLKSKMEMSCLSKTIWTEIRNRHRNSTLNHPSVVTTRVISVYPAKHVLLIHPVLVYHTRMLSRYQVYTTHIARGLWGSFQSRLCLIHTIGYTLQINRRACVHESRGERVTAVVAVVGYMWFRITLNACLLSRFN